MIGLLKALPLAFVVMTVVYVLVSIYSRSIRREKLEKAWDTDPAREGAAKDERDAYIKSGMEAYRHGLRRKLIWLVYVIPTVTVAALVWILNFE